MGLILDLLCKFSCKTCRKGWNLRYRPATREWVHDNKRDSMFSITLCTAAKWQEIKAHGWFGKQ